MTNFTTGMRDRLRDLWRDDRGQSTTEYILILAVVVMVAMKFRSAFQGKLEKAVESLGSKIEEGTNIQ